MTAIRSSLSLQCAFVYMPVTMCITSRLGNLSIPYLFTSLLRYALYQQYFELYFSHNVSGNTQRRWGWRANHPGWVVLYSYFYLTSLCWMRNSKWPIAKHYSTPYCQERVSKCFVKWNELLFFNKTFQLCYRLTEINQLISYKL